MNKFECFYHNFKHGDSAEEQFEEARQSGIIKSYFLTTMGALNARRVTDFCLWCDEVWSVDHKCECAPDYNCRFTFGEDFEGMAFVKLPRHVLKTLDVNDLLNESRHSCAHKVFDEVSKPDTSCLKEDETNISDAQKVLDEMPLPEFIREMADAANMTPDCNSIECGYKSSSDIIHKAEDDSLTYERQLFAKLSALNDSYFQNLAIIHAQEHSSDHSPRVLKELSDDELMSSNHQPFQVNIQHFTILHDIHPKNLVNDILCPLLSNNVDWFMGSNLFNYLGVKAYNAMVFELETDRWTFLSFKELHSWGKLEVESVGNKSYDVHCCLFVYDLRDYINTQRTLEFCQTLDLVLLPMRLITEHALSLCCNTLSATCISLSNKSELRQERNVSVSIFTYAFEAKGDFRDWEDTLYSKYTRELSNIVVLWPTECCMRMEPMEDKIQVFDPGVIWLGCLGIVALKVIHVTNIFVAKPYDPLIVGPYFLAKPTLCAIFDHGGYYKLLRMASADLVITMVITWSSKVIMLCIFGAILFTFDPGGPEYDAYCDGSGAATIHAIQQLGMHYDQVAKLSDGNTNSHSLLGNNGSSYLPYSDVLAKKHILLLHAGGDSKRDPWASSMGKVFLPLPYLAADDPADGPDGPVPLLIDHILVISSCARQAFKNGGGLFIMTGNVLPCFDASSMVLPKNTSCIITVPITFDIASNHGVVVAAENGTVDAASSVSLVDNLLQKTTVEELVENQALLEDGRTLLHTGIIAVRGEAWVELACSGQSLIQQFLENDKHNNLSGTIFVFDPGGELHTSMRCFGWQIPILEDKDHFKRRVLIHT